MAVDIEYIKSSGMIERYALGQASCHEAEVLEDAMSQNPEVKQLVDDACIGMEAMASASARKMPEGLETLVMASLSTPDHLSGTAPKSEESSDKVFSLPAFTAGLAAAAALAGVLIVTGVLGGGKAKSLQAKLDTTQERIEALQLAQDEREAQLSELVAEFELITDPATSKVALDPVAAGGDASALVYWNSFAQALYIDSEALPVLGEDEQYQLWAIVDAGPLSMGVLALNDSREVLAVPDFENPAAFAITVEPIGGSVSPTLDKMVVLGNT